MSINSVLPALVAGNSVLLKPSPQTPLTAERLALALTRAGVPQDVIQVVHLPSHLTTHVIQHSLVDFISFTGSVANGRAVEAAATSAKRFKGVALEVRRLLLLPSKLLISCSWEARTLHMFDQMQIWTTLWPN